MPYSHKPIALLSKIFAIYHTACSFFEQAFFLIDKIDDKYASTGFKKRGS
jgi:hypothetical protein